VDNDERIERCRNSFEGLGKPPVKGGFRAHHQHFYAQQPAVGLRQGARIIQCACGKNDLFHEFGTNAAAPVQHPLDRGGSNACETGDIAVIRPAHIRFPDIDVSIVFKTGRVSVDRIRGRFRRYG
jgi:hypothetical protein